MPRISKSHPDTWRSSPLIVTSYIDVSLSLGEFSTGLCGFGWRFGLSNRGKPFHLYFIPARLAGAAYGQPIITVNKGSVSITRQQSIDLNSPQTSIGKCSGPSSFTISVRFPDLDIDIPLPPPLPAPIPQALTTFEDLLSKTFRGEEIFDLKFWAFSRRTKGVAAHPKAIYASRSLLPQQLDWLENLLLPHDFVESKIVNIDDSDASEFNHRLNSEHYMHHSDSDLEDDDFAEEAFHMLGQRTPNNHPEGPDRLQVVDGVASKSRGVQTQYLDDRLPSRETPRFGQVIAINDTAHRTFEALLWYTYTEKIEFRHLSSLASTPDEQTDEAKPRDFRCSPKSMYRLADKFNIEELKALSYSAIESNLCESNIVTELSSQLAYLYPPIQQMQAEYLAANFTLKVQEDLSYLVKDIVTQKVSPKAGHGMIMTIFLNLIKKGNANNPVLSLPVAYPEEEVKDES